MQIAGREVLCLWSCPAPWSPWALGCELIHFAVTPLAGAGSRSARRAWGAVRAECPCLMEQKTDQQRQDRWDRRGSKGTGMKSGKKATEVQRKGCWAPVLGLPAAGGETEGDLLSLCFLIYKTGKESLSCLPQRAFERLKWEGV